MPLAQALQFGARAGAVAANVAAPGVGSVLAGLLTDPVWGAIAAELGLGAAGKFLGLGGQSDIEQANQQRLQAAQSVFPDLRRAAAGLPTASSNNISRQVRREGTAMQQSMAASARGAGQLGGTPQGGSAFRAQSERIHVGQQEALSQRLGQHQIAAQQLLLGQLQPAIQTGNTFANQDRDDESMIKGALGRLGRKFAENPNDDIVNRLIDVLGKLGVSDGITAGTSSNINTPTPGLPSTPVRRPIQNQFTPVGNVGIGNLGVGT